MSGPGRVLRDAVGRFFFTGSSPERLGILRIAIGLGMIAFHVLQFDNLFQLELDGPRWYYIDPIWYFKLLGVEFLDPLAAWLVFGVLIAATLCFAAGFHTRTALTILLLSILYLKGVRDSVAGDVHHRYLIPFHVLLYFGFSRAGDVLSLDALRARRRGRPREPLQEWEASWPIMAAQLYTASFYLWSGIAKLRMTGLEWASAERLQSLLLSRAVRFGFSEGVPAGSTLAFELAQQETLCAILGASTYLFEMGFPLILFIRNTHLRLIFFAGVTLFHVANYFLISVKFLFLPVIFLIFFDVAAPLRWWRARWGRERDAAVAS